MRVYANIEYISFMQTKGLLFNFYFDYVRGAHIKTSLHNTEGLLTFKRHVIWVDQTAKSFRKTETLLVLFVL